MKSDQTFIDIFLEFLNDKTANARAAEARFMAHPHVRNGIKRGFPFQQSFNVSDYQGLRKDMETLLKQVRDGTKAAQRKEIVDKLNSLALRIPLRDKNTGDPIVDDSGDPMAWSILGTVIFQLESRFIEIGAEPVVNGMEFACWYALLLISRQPGKTRRCTLESCNRWFNKVATRTVGYCSRAHSRQAEEINARIRASNARHPDRPKRIVIATAPKRQRKSRW
jgi:hypothetical protein